MPISIKWYRLGKLLEHFSKESKVLQALKRVTNISKDFLNQAFRVKYNKRARIQTYYFTLVCNRDLTGRRRLLPFQKASF